MYNSTDCVVEVYYPDFYSTLTTFQQNAGGSLVLLIGILVI